MSVLGSVRQPIARAVRRSRLLHGRRLRRLHLEPSGWLASVVRWEGVDAEGQPVPWITYPCRHLLEQRLPTDIRVFEYGAGSSTAWWSRRASAVVAVEHDRDWYGRMIATMPPTATLIHRDLGDDYVDEPIRHGRFDVVVVDGRKRSACALAAVDCLTDRGVIVWDDTHRPRYQDGIATLMGRGFRHAPFQGLRPMSYVADTTSIFYRDGNVLGL